MPDKFNIAGVEFVLPADNTKVDVGTKELPKWKAPFTPNLEYGKEQYYKGNYLDPHAQVYASRISGKAESVSPEFEIMTMLGPKADLKYTGSNTYYQRVKNGSYKNLGLTKEEADDVLDDLYNNTVNLDNYTDYKELAKDLNVSERMAKRLIYVQDPISFMGIRTNGDGLILYRGSKIDQKTFNELLPHEVHHGLSYKASVLHPIKDNYPRVNQEKFIRQAQIEGWPRLRMNEYYNYMTEYNADEMAARGVQLKNELGIVKDRDITPEELKTLSETYPNKFNNNMKAFFVLL